MTFAELIKDAQDKYQIIDVNVIYSIIFYLSKKANNKVNLIVNLQKPIDFELKQAYTLFDKYANQKIPLAYITNQVDFCGINLFVNEDVLIPRIETEMMVDEIINEYKDKQENLKVLDLCSGSGCIGLAIKKHLHKAEVYLIDKYDGPINVINKNKDRLNLDVNVIQMDLEDFLQNPFTQFDLIICNPPYVSEDFKIDEYCQKEPKVALFAKDQGLYYIKKIIDHHKSILRHNGSLFIEIGYDQYSHIHEYTNYQKLTINNYIDIYNINRYIRMTNN